jgi:hypothetical protein
LRAEGEAKAIATVFDAIHKGDADKKLLSYEYLQMLPELARGDANKVFVIASEFTHAFAELGEALAHRFDIPATNGSPPAADQSTFVADGSTPATAGPGGPLRQDDQHLTRPADSDRARTPRTSTPVGRNRVAGARPLGAGRSGAERSRGSSRW